MSHYGGHTRDVLINLRDRIVLGLVEDNPTPKAMFTAARVDLGLYDRDDPITLGDELRLAAELFSRTISALTKAQLARPIHYGWPRPDSELQVLQFADRESFDRYLTDPRRTSMLEERDRVVARTEVTEAVLLS